MFTQGVSPSVSHQGLCPRLSPPTLDTAGQKKGGVEADSNFFSAKRLVETQSEYDQSRNRLNYIYIYI